MTFLKLRIPTLYKLLLIRISFKRAMCILLASERNVARSFSTCTHVYTEQGYAYRSNRAMVSTAKSLPDSLLGPTFARVMNMLTRLAAIAGVLRTRELRECIFLTSQVRHWASTAACTIALGHSHIS